MKAWLPNFCHTACDGQIFSTAFFRPHRHSTEWRGLQTETFGSFASSLLLLPHPASSARVASSTSVFFPPAAVLDHTAGDKVQGFALVQQRNRNSLMHSKYGNTTLRLQPLGTVVQAKVELSLEALIPNFTYTRSFLLQCHTPPEPNNDLYPQLPILIDRSQPHHGISS